MASEKKLEFNTRLTREDVAGIIEALIVGLKDGHLKVQKSGETLELEVPRVVDLEIEAKLSSERAKFEIEVSWRTNRAEIPDDPDMEAHAGETDPKILARKAKASVKNAAKAAAKAAKSAGKAVRDTAAAAGSTVKATAKAAKKAAEKSSSQAAKAVKHAAHNALDSVESAARHARDSMRDITKDAARISAERADKKAAQKGRAKTIDAAAAPAPESGAKTYPPQDGGGARPAASKASKSAKHGPAKDKAPQKTDAAKKTAAAAKGKTSAKSKTTAKSKVPAKKKDSAAAKATDGKAPSGA